MTTFVSQVTYICCGVCPTSKTASLSQMTLNQFKTEILAGETAEFRPCFNEANKATLRAKTSKGIIFMDAAIAKSKKQLYVEQSYQDGKLVFNIVDTAPVFSF